MASMKLGEAAASEILCHSPVGGAALGRDSTPTATSRVMSAVMTDVRPTQDTQEILSSVWMDATMQMMTEATRYQTTVQAPCSVIVLKATVNPSIPTPAIAALRIYGQRHQSKPERVLGSSVTNPKRESHDELADFPTDEKPHVGERVAFGMTQLEDPDNVVGPRGDSTDNEDDNYCGYITKDKEHRGLLQSVMIDRQSVTVKKTHQTQYTEPNLRLELYDTSPDPAQVTIFGGVLIEMAPDGIMDTILIRRFVRSLGIAVVYGDHSIVLSVRRCFEVICDRIPRHDSEES